MSVAPMLGARVGRWTVVDRAEGRGGSWLCVCECGTRRVVLGARLRRGRSRSCGCLKNDLTVARFSTHGASRRGPLAPLFAIWNSMIRRCHTPSSGGYRDYGGRGIEVCDEWRGDFLAFARAVGDRPSPLHSLDRIDNSKGYAPGNVRWATPTEQSRNTRRNRALTVRGETMCLAAWAERVGLRRMTISNRIKSGWSVEDSVLTPLGAAPSGRTKVAP